MTSSIAHEVKEVIENVIKAYEYLSKLVGGGIPKEELEEVLKEATHLLVHELTHAAIHTAYPKIEEIWEENEVLGECVDEVGGRVLELLVSKELRIPTHTVEEHLHELKHYTNLTKLPITKEELSKLYNEAISKLRNEGIKASIKTIEMNCREWLRKVS